MYIHFDNDILWGCYCKVIKNFYVMFSQRNISSINTASKIDGVANYHEWMSASSSVNEWVSQWNYVYVCSIKIKHNI